VPPPGTRQLGAAIAGGSRSNSASSLNSRSNSSKSLQTTMRRTPPKLREKKIQPMQCNNLIQRQGNFVTFGTKRHICDDCGTVSERTPEYDQCSSCT
jgi:rubrerythrin